MNKRPLPWNNWKDYPEGFPVPVDRAWAAGFFDGEGGCYCYSKGQCRQLSLVISQNDRRPLDDFRDVVGTGRVKLQARGIHLLTVSSFENVVHAVEMLWPYLSEPKKDQIRNAFSDYAGTSSRAFHRTTPVIQEVLAA